MGAVPAHVGGRGDRSGSGGDDLLRAGNGRRVRLPVPSCHVVPTASRARRARTGARDRALAVARPRGLDRGRGLRARGGPPDVRDLPLDPVRRVPRRARVVGAEGLSRRVSCPRRARRSRCALHALAPTDRERHALGVAGRGRGPASVRPVRRSARRPLGTRRTTSRQRCSRARAPSPWRLYS